MSRDAVNSLVVERVKRLASEGAQEMSKRSPDEGGRGRVRIKVLCSRGKEVFSCRLLYGVKGSKNWARAAGKSGTVGSKSGIEQPSRRVMQEKGGGDVEGDGEGLHVLEGNIKCSKMLGEPENERDVVKEVNDEEVVLKLKVSDAVAELLGAVE